MFLLHKAQGSAQDALDANCTALSAQTKTACGGCRPHCRSISSSLLAFSSPAAANPPAPLLALVDSLHQYLQFGQQLSSWPCVCLSAATRASGIRHTAIAAVHVLKHSRDLLLQVFEKLSSISIFLEAKITPQLPVWCAIFFVLQFCSSTVRHSSAVLTIFAITIASRKVLHGPTSGASVMKNRTSTNTLVVLHGYHRRHLSCVCLLCVHKTHSGYSHRSLTSSSLVAVASRQAPHEIFLRRRVGNRPKMRTRGRSCLAELLQQLLGIAVAYPQGSPQGTVEGQVLRDNILVF